MIIYLQTINDTLDRVKFEQLYQEYKAFMHGIAYQILRNQQDAEDAVHNAFLSIAKNIEKIGSPTSPKTRGYVSIIVERKAIDLYRERKKNMANELLEEDIGISVPFPNDHTLAWCIAKLPPRYRQIIFLKYSHGYSVKEIADILGISHTAASKLDQRAKKETRKDLSRGGCLMISDERLREAARQAEKALLASLPEPKDCKATFSPEFEWKMKKLVKRTDHPIVYWIQKSVACLMLILLLGGGSVLALSAEARAAFVGWVREVYESWFVYHYTGEDAITTENIIYYPRWLPDGYELLVAPEPGPHTISIYENQAKDTIIFNCFKNRESMAIQIGKENAFVEKVQIEDVFADLYVDSKSGETNHLIWEDPEKKLFFG